jgi:elongation factor G
MKVYPSRNIRNIGLVSHQGAGKTSLAEAFIFNTGAISRLGKVDEGNTVADYTQEEIKRKSTVNTSLISCEWKDNKINLLDTPGFSDFFAEISATLRVADSLVMLIDAVAGAEVSTGIIWDLADEHNIPIVVFINKMDRENADFEKAFASLQGSLSRHAVAVQMPIGRESAFSGVIDLISMKAYEYDNGKPVEIPIPENMLSQAEAAHETMVEIAAEGEDEITMKYLDGETLTQEEILTGLRCGIEAGKIVPVMCGSATKNIGVASLMILLVNFSPDPLVFRGEEAAALPPAALLFKTMTDAYVGKISLFKVMQGKIKGDSLLYNANKEIDEKIGQLITMQGKNSFPLPELNCGDIGAVSKLSQTSTGNTLTTKDSGVIIKGIDFPVPNLTFAISPKSKGDEDKLGNAISRILEEEPTLRYEKSAETKQTLLTGLGEAHLNIVIERLQKKFGVGVNVVELKIPYRETIRGTAQKIEGKHKKQSGGHGQYGHVYIDIAPSPDDDFVFEEKIFGGAVPKQYIPAVEKGIRESMVEGILAGFPVCKIKVVLVDGSYHDVDSSEMAFKLAANIAFKKACEQAKPILLEPCANVNILVPDQYMGDIIGDMNTKRGRILGMEKQGKNQLVKAQAPIAELSRYVIDLKSITQGKGKFTMEFSHYEEAPANVAEKIIAKARAAKEG